MADNEPGLPFDDAEIQRRMDFADAALGAAGHEVRDPFLRELRQRAIRGEISVEEAIATGASHRPRRR